MTAICDLGADALVSAIISQAVKDWYQCEEAFIAGRESAEKKNDGVHMAGAPLARQKMIEEFFSSAWFKTISDLDGPQLVVLMRSGPCFRIRNNAVRKVKGKRIDRSWRLLDGFPELQQRLRESGVSQRELARAMGVSPTTLADWMRGGPDPALIRWMKETLDRIRGEQ